MPRFLIDANLPYRFSLWRSADFVHVFDIGDDLPDSAIWQYAAQNNLVIVTKDADFSNWIMLTEPPPRVIHLRIGNMRLRDLFAFIERIWPQLEIFSACNKLIIVHSTLIECIT